MASVSRYKLRRYVTDDEGRRVLDPDTGKPLREETGETVWRARYRDAAGKEHVAHRARKVDAQRWLDAQTASLVRGDHVEPGRGRVALRAMAEPWRENPNWTASTKARNESILEQHVLPRWGAVRLVDVEHEAVQAWVNELVAAGLAGGTVRKVVGVLAGVLQLAVKARRIAVNPARGVELPKQALTRRRYLTAAQVEAVADAADEWGDLVLVLAYCGLRIGEAAALRVRHVDMLRRRFRIEEAVTEVDGKLVWSSPKDHQRRSVPWPPFLTEDLAERLSGKGRDDLVFPAARGGAVRVRNMRRDWFDLAAAAAGVEGLTPHELRHTAASLAVSAGASVLALQRMLGHDKASTTLNVYSDLFDEDLDDMAEKLGEVRARGVADSVRTRAGAQTRAVVAIGR
ncbi:tyrosine-type recombinase/integrase [Georgenia sp. M64]|uniref:tyrosine-type recombinase/integrase n=1 Tax=Georgenia sp. M64 TaxID=3120520 RepID=UPI0030E5262D